MCTSTFIATDTIKPTLTCPTKMVLNSTSDSCTVSMPDMTAIVNTSDNCQVQSVEQSIPINTLLRPGTFEVNVTVLDGHGNSAYCIIPIEVKDVSTPEITCTSYISATGNRALIPNITSVVTYEDNCVSVEISQIPEVGTEVAVGIHSIQVTAKDHYGNSANCSIDFEVIQSLSPESTVQDQQSSDSVPVAAIVVPIVIVVALIAATLVVLYLKAKASKKIDNDVHLETISQ